jgi:hypothetical protein
MMFAFNDTTRRLIESRCAAFTRLTGGTLPALKHAAVAITLVGPTTDQAKPH